MVPRPGPWQTRGTHQFSLWLPWPVVIQEFPQPLPSTSSVANIEARREDLDPAFECEVMQQGRWLGGMCELPNCPLIVDTARDGYKLTSVENGVRFDLNADGVPEQVAWTRRESDDAFLALDRNGNGRIDDGSELFGNHTPAGPETPEITTPNGFEALKFVETSSYGPKRAQRGHHRARCGILPARDSGETSITTACRSPRNCSQCPNRAWRRSAPSTRTASASTSMATSSVSARASSGRTASTTTSSTSGCNGATDALTFRSALMINQQGQGRALLALRTSSARRRARPVVMGSGRES